MVVGWEDVRVSLKCPYSSRDLSGPDLPRMVKGFSADDLRNVLATMHGPAPPTATPHSPAGFHRQHRRAVADTVP